MNLDQTIKEYPNLIVEFYTDWSASSFMVGEMIKELEQEFESPIEIKFIDADTATEECREYGVFRIPTLLFFKNGEVIKYLHGTPSRADILAAIEIMLKTENLEER